MGSQCSNIYSAKGSQDLTLRMNFGLGMYEIERPGAAALAQCKGCKFPLDPGDGVAPGTWTSGGNQVNATVQCCPGQTWPCDTCQEDSCRRHKSFAACEAMHITIQRCCFFDLSAGVCSCDRNKATTCEAQLSNDVVV